jgi:hypothetical protein
MSLKKDKKDNKLSPKYYGPYKVLQKIGNMAYKLELLASSRVHPVFHVSCLNKVIGDNIPVQTVLLELDEEGKIILEPEAITDTRIRQLRNRSISEYLIKWRKLPAEDSTWEDESFIQNSMSLWNHMEIVLNVLLVSTQNLSLNLVLSEISSRESSTYDLKIEI